MTRSLAQDQAGWNKVPATKSAHDANFSIFGGWHLSPFWILESPLASCLFSRTLDGPLRETPSMTSAVRELLRSFQSLSDAEKHEAANLLLRQVVQGEAGNVGDDALVAVAEELFLDLDAREAGDGQSSCHCP